MVSVSLHACPFPGQAQLPMGPAGHNLGEGHSLGEGRPRGFDAPIILIAND